MPHTCTPLAHVIGLQLVSVQPAPRQTQRDPPLQSTLHDTAARQSTSQVDLSAQATSTVRPASTATVQLLPPLQLALHVLPVAQVNRQSQPLAPQLKLHFVAAWQVCAQHGLHIVLQSDEHADPSLVARSATLPPVTPIGSLGSNGTIAASGGSSDAIGSPVRLKLHAPTTKKTANHVQRIHLGGDADGKG